MIMTVNELKQFITTSVSDQVLGAKLQALELMLRKYTNNNFQARNFRTSCVVLVQKLFTDYPLFAQGDTVQISGSIYNDGIYVVQNIADGFIELDANLVDEPRVIVTKVVYPADIKQGVVNMIKWDLENREKVGIQSETISRHSVTYFNMDGDNALMGYPKSLLGFLNPYMKARF